MINARLLVLLSLIFLTLPLHGQTSPTKNRKHRHRTKIAEADRTSALVHAYTSSRNLDRSESDLPLPPPPAPEDTGPIRESQATTKNLIGTSESPLLTGAVGATRTNETHEAVDVSGTYAGFSTADETALNEVFEQLGLLQNQMPDVGVPEVASNTRCQRGGEDNHAGMPTNLKNESELRRYVTCYSDHPEWTKAYVESYIHEIRAASVQFDIPETLLTCLLFRESQFNPNAVSIIDKNVHGHIVATQGAQGIAQFMPVTEKFITALISARNITPNKLTLLQNVANGVGHPSQHDQAYAETALENYHMAMQWSGYFDRLHAQGLYQGDAPSTFSSVGAKIPKIAIGASAFYLRFMIDLFEGDLTPANPSIAGTTSLPNANFLLAIAGSYNMGHGAALSVLHGVASQSTRSWTNRLSRANGQTADHITSIRNCMQPGNFKPSVGTEQRTCQ